MLGQSYRRLLPSFTTQVTGTNGVDSNCDNSSTSSAHRSRPSVLRMWNRWGNDMRGCGHGAFSSGHKLFHRILCLHYVYIHEWQKGRGAILSHPRQCSVQSTNDERGCVPHVLHALLQRPSAILRTTTAFWCISLRDTSRSDSHSLGARHSLCARASHSGYHRSSSLRAETEKNASAAHGGILHYGTDNRTRWHALFSFVSSQVKIRFFLYEV